MTDLEISMENMIVVFHRYAKDDGCKKVLAKKDLKKLLEAELPNFLTTQTDPKLLDNIMGDLDENKDNKLEFEEFVPFVAGLSNACEKCYNQSQKQSKKQDVSSKSDHPATPATATDLENSMENLIMVFHRYAKDDGCKKVLAKKDLKKLLEAELANFLKAQKDPKLLDKIMSELDVNKDDKLEFEEFLPFVAGLSYACEKRYNQGQSKN